MRLVLFYLMLVAVACSPIWGVKYFVNQDGAAHVYSAAVMLELAANDPSVAEVYAFNSAVPNSSGHWLLAFLLVFLNPFIATKIVVTLTFAGFVAAVGWLRWSTHGRDGVKTSLLLGAALGFNWMWLLGFYNFLIGVIVFVFVLGLFSFWRNEMNWQRAAVLSGLFLVAYFSHVVSFGILVCAVFLLCIFTRAANRSRSIVWAFAAILPVLPFAIWYKLSGTIGAFDPVWVVLNDPGSLSSWLTHLRMLDPFVIISRRALPFTAETSGFYALLSPVLLIVIACSLLAVASLWKKDDRDKVFWEHLPYLIAMSGLILLAVVAPDEFRSSKGGFLRPRLILCGLVLFVPLFRIGSWHFAKRFAQAALIVVIVYQTAALWEYAIKADKEATEFLSVGEALKNSDTVGSIVILNGPARFYAEPTTQMSNFLGFRRGVIVYDNYEIGHTLFPVAARHSDDQKFVREFTDAKVIRIHDPNENIDEKLSRLSSSLELYNQKINTMVVWGQDLGVEAVLQKWYESKPFFENGRVRAYRYKHRPSVENSAGVEIKDVNE